MMSELSGSCKNCSDSSYSGCKDWYTRFVYGCPKEDYKTTKPYGKSLFTPIHNKLKILILIDESMRNVYE